jgi:hypothetical protein
MNIDDSSNLKLISTINKDKKYQIKNQRPDEYLEEREIYEKLCRQNGTQVEISIEFIDLFFLFIS